MIPKIIHYCWFGQNPFPPLAVKYIESWKKYCPDFEIKEWNETNFDVKIMKYSKEAAETNQWAFVSDIARLYIIYNHGGVYLDIDVEIIKPLENFLNHNMFIGFENAESIATGLGFGAEKNFYLIKKMLDSYNNMSFINPDKTINNTPSPMYTTITMKEEGFLINNSKQILNGVMLYPTEYLCPKDWYTGETNITENTHTIHHFFASWWSDERKKQHKIMQRVAKLSKNYLAKMEYKDEQNISQN